MKRVFAFLVALVLQTTACAQPSDVRALDLTLDGKWIGAGVSYGEYRDGQSPDGDGPTVEQIREDLHIIKDHWQLIRMYGTRSAENVCKVIREDNLPIRFMVGAWITTESSPENIAANKSEVAAAIRIANAYPDVVIAVNVGNETQVFWTGHKVKRETLIGYIRQVRSNTRVPVTTCDDYNFWNKPESQAVAAECDFLGLHAYAMWNKQQLADAVEWTRQQIDAVQSLHPGLQIVHCESGWATAKQTTGEQGRQIVAPAGEAEQELFYREYRRWATQVQLPHFYFAAFDEKWKGGPDPNEVEKHWGLFNADRTPKQAIRSLTSQPAGTSLQPEDLPMKATANGPFEVAIAPQADGPEVSDPIIGRMSLDKKYQGDLEADSKGMMLGVRTEVKGSAGYVAMERVVGTLAGRSGSFVLQHSSTLDRGTPVQSITVVPDSGTDQLAGLAGSMTIEITEGQHFYHFEYWFASSQP